MKATFINRCAFAKKTMECYVDIPSYNRCCCGFRYYKQLRPSWTSNVPGKSIEIIVDKKTVKNITVKDGQVVSMVGDSKIVSNVKDNKVKDATKFTSVQVLDKDNKVTQSIVSNGADVVITCR